MTYLDELKMKRKEIDAKIKEIENKNVIRCGRARYEHRVYPTGRAEEIIAVNRPRELHGQKYSEWWGQVINAKTKKELVANLKEVMVDLNALLEKLESEDNA